VVGVDGNIPLILVLPIPLLPNALWVLVFRLLPLGSELAEETSIVGSHPLFNEPDPQYVSSGLESGAFAGVLKPPAVSAN
jgi:hypothetical protein